MERFVVARADEIPPGGRKLVTVRGREVVVFNVEGELFALLDRCPHQGGSLCRGKLVGLVESDEPGRYRYHRQGEIIRCPWHGWEFDLRTGKSRCDPKRTWSRAIRRASRRAPGSPKALRRRDLRGQSRGRVRDHRGVTPGHAGDVQGRAAVQRSSVRMNSLPSSRRRPSTRW